MRDFIIRADNEEAALNAATGSKVFKELGVVDTQGKGKPTWKKHGHNHSLNIKGVAEDGYWYAELRVRKYFSGRVADGLRKSDGIVSR